MNLRNRSNATSPRKDLQADDTMKHPDGVQKARRTTSKAGQNDQGTVLAKRFPAPAAHGQAPRWTALSPDPCYSDELFDKYPPHDDWTEEDLNLMKDEHRGLQMLRPSPTSEQLQAWGVDSYEEFCIRSAYHLP